MKKLCDIDIEESSELCRDSIKSTRMKMVLANNGNAKTQNANNENISLWTKNMPIFKKK